MLLQQRRAVAAGVSTLHGRRRLSHLVSPIQSMRITFAILSFCTAGSLAFHVIPVVSHVVIPYWRQRGQERMEGVEMQLGPFWLNEPQVCILEGVLTLLIIGLILAGIYALTSRRTTA